MSGKSCSHIFYSPDILFDYTKSKLNHQRKQPQEIETNWNALQFNIWYLAIINGKWKSKFDKNTKTMKSFLYEWLIHLPHVDWYERAVNLKKKQYSYQFLLSFIWSIRNLPQYVWTLIEQLYIVYLAWQCNKCNKHHANIPSVFQNLLSMSDSYIYKYIVTICTGTRRYIYFW